MSISNHKARSLDRSSSTSTEARYQQKSRSRSEPQKSRSNNGQTTPTSNQLIVSSGVCGLPDFYSTILGPTADETILVGLETLLKVGFGCNTEALTTAASENSLLEDIRKDADSDREKESSEDDRFENSNSEDDINIIDTKDEPQTEPELGQKFTETKIEIEETSVLSSVQKENEKRISSITITLSEGKPSSQESGFGKAGSKVRSVSRDILRPSIEEAEPEKDLIIVKSTQKIPDKKSSDVEDYKSIKSKQREAKSSKKLTPDKSKTRKKRSTSTFGTVQKEQIFDDPKTRKPDVVEKEEILDDSKSSQHLTPTESRIKKERPSFTFNAIKEEDTIDRYQPIEETDKEEKRSNHEDGESDVQWIVEIHKPTSLEMIISTPGEYIQEEVKNTKEEVKEKPLSSITRKSKSKETVTMDKSDEKLPVNEEEIGRSREEVIKEESRSISSILRRLSSSTKSAAAGEKRLSSVSNVGSSDKPEEESRRESTRSSLEKRVLISNLKPVPKENELQSYVEEPRDVSTKQPSSEANASKTSSVLSQYKIVIESGNATSEIVVEENASPRSSESYSKEIVHPNSEEELANNIVSEIGRSSELSQERAQDLNGSSIGATNLEETSTLSSKKVSVESSQQSDHVGSQATLSIEIVKKSLEDSQNASAIRQNGSKMSHELTSIIIPEESEEDEETHEESDTSDESESPTDKPSSFIQPSQVVEDSKYQDEESTQSTLPGLESTELPSIHSKLSSNKSSVSWSSHHELRDRESIGSKKSRDLFSKRSEKDSRGSVRSFDRTSKGSKPSKHSYETSFDNVKVKISQETIEEVTEESDEDYKLESMTEPDQSSKSTTPEQSHGIDKPIKSKSSILVKVSEEIVDDINGEISEKSEQIKRKSKQSLTSSKKSKSSSSDTKVKRRRETSVEVTEETVESDYSIISKKSDSNRSRSKRSSLHKTSVCTGPEIAISKYTAYSSPVLQLRKSTHDKSSSASILKSTTSSSKTDSYTCTCNIKGDIDVCQSGDSNSKCACCVCSERRFSEKFPQIPCPFIKPNIKSTIRKLNGVCSCCTSTKTEEKSSDENKKQTLCFDCYTSTSSSTGTDSETSKWLQNGVVAKGQIRYAITKITEYGKYTTFEIMKSTRKVPKFMPTRLEGVFVLKHKM